MRRLGFLIAVAALAVPSTAAAQSGTIAFHQKTFDDRARTCGSPPPTARAAPCGSRARHRRRTRPRASRPAAAEAPDWTPDGSRLYFDSSWTPFVHIWSMKPDGTDARQETFSAGFDGFPRSPGRQHARLRYSDDADDPASTGSTSAPSTGGGAPVRLTVAPKRGFDTNPDFSPDGNQGRVPARPVQRMPSEGLRPPRRDRLHRRRSGSWAPTETAAQDRRRRPGLGRPALQPRRSRILIQATTTARAARAESGRTSTPCARTART